MQQKWSLAFLSELQHLFNNWLNLKLGKYKVCTILHHHLRAWTIQYWTFSDYLLTDCAANPFFSQFLRSGSQNIFEWMEEGLFWQRTPTFLAAPLSISMGSVKKGSPQNPRLHICPKIIVFIPSNFMKVGFIF